MGSSPKAQKGHQPATAEAGPIAVGGETDAGPAELTIRLIHVREAIHNRTGLGDPVTVVAGARPLLALVPAGALGEVPPQHRHGVETMGYDSGEVARLSADPVEAWIVMRRN